jgi:formylglycine-generating enzyme required for sulfatase activity
VSDAQTAAISMEYVAGDTLSGLRADQPDRHFEAADLREWVRQLCEALDYAHAKAKVVHRDLKPANLMMDARGDLKIADFGISSSVADSVSRLSARAGTSGTPVYMSPQQMLGEKPAPTDDIYSLGATLYDLLTGKPPFHSGRIETQVMQKAPPSLAERRAELEVPGQPVPAAWEETIAACLAKDPAQRPQSAGEVARRLGVGPALPPSPGRLWTGAAGPRRSAALKWALGAAAIIAIAATTWWLFVAANRTVEVTAALKKNLGPEEGQAWTVPDLGLVLVPIPAGTFTMGSPDSEQGRGNDEGPQTQVTLTRAFWLGRTEVTQAQWEAVIRNNPSGFKGADLPVEQVSWDDAMAFCRRLTERERAAGRLPDGYVYTLPTEAQWEYACRAGTTGPYAGDGNLDDMGWYSQNSGNTTHPVGQKRPNAWGLYDMHGNVWEWCRDWYGNYPGGLVRDPTGPASGSYRVNRGGCWNYPATECHSASRYFLGPGDRLYFFGFRLALSPTLTK